MSFGKSFVAPIIAIPIKGGVQGGPESSHDAPPRQLTWGLRQLWKWPPSEAISRFCFSPCARCHFQSGCRSACNDLPRGGVFRGQWPIAGMKNPVSFHSSSWCGRPVWQSGLHCCQDIAHDMMVNRSMTRSYRGCKHSTPSSRRARTTPKPPRPSHRPSSLSGCSLSLRLWAATARARARAAHARTRVYLVVHSFPTAAAAAAALTWFTGKSATLRPSALDREEIKSAL